LLYKNSEQWELAVVYFDAFTADKMLMLHFAAAKLLCFHACCAVMFVGATATSGIKVDFLVTPEIG
ncbi:hypothetical protein V5799_012579, partial [Amblyomma americanum]